MLSLGSGAVTTAYLYAAMNEWLRRVMISVIGRGTCLLLSLQNKLHLDCGDILETTWNRMGAKKEQYAWRCNNFFLR